jgi:DNA polymerase delta subunit 1
MDFASLYPSSIIQKNLSGETQILDPKYDNLDNCEYYDTTYKTLTGEKFCRFVKKKDKLGIIPKTLKYLLDERKAIKKRMKNTSDPFKKRILDGQQLAMKVTANSIYGQTGAITSPIYLKDIAACTTATGKEMLMRAEYFMTTVFPNMLLDDDSKQYLDSDEIAFIKNFNSNYSISPIVVYGDTDSTFVSLNIKDTKTNKVLVDDLSREYSIKLGLIADKLASTYFPYPQYLEYEKVYHKWAIFCKKKYTGRLYETDPHNEFPAPVKAPAPIPPAVPATKGTTKFFR